MKKKRERPNYFNRFTDSFNSMLKKLECDKKVSASYRVSNKLHDDLVKKLEDYEGLTRADVIEVAFVEFAYGDQRKNKLK